MSRSMLPTKGGFTHATKASAVAAVAAIIAAGLGAAPATSAPSDACPTATDISTLTRGESVTGLTVSQGTAPEDITGTVLGVLTDGIAPGLDMVIVRLNSSTIDQVGGIWEGMSGSPVYAPDGSLIGAVSYGLGVGPSHIAGVTPASEMQKLLAKGGGSDPTPAPAARVTLSPRLQQRVVASGAATTAEASTGMTQLKIPFSIGHIRGNAKRVHRITKLFKSSAYRMVPMGTAPAGTVGDASSIIAGGNIAASMSYGDITAAGVGTTTEVCGTKVLAFGHPFSFSGLTTLTMHSADAIVIQDDPTVAPFKLANIGGPVGTIDEDRMAGIKGFLGDAPTTSDITSTVTADGASRTGTTHISLPDAFSDLAVTHVLVDTDRVFDSVGKGSGTMSYTINGTREDGSPFTLQRDDVYANPYDISAATAFDLYGVLATLQYNGIEDIKFTNVTTDSTLDHTYVHYDLAELQRRSQGVWAKVGQRRTLRLPAGTTQHFRVLLTSKDLGTKTVPLDIKIPRADAGRFGFVEAFGGDSGRGSSQDGGFVVFGRSAAGSSGKTFDDVLNALQQAPHNDDVVGDFVLFNNHGNVGSRTRQKTATGHVVDGDVTVPVRITR
ncbi:MAG: hypothetical protein ACXVEV_16120 [Nocardioidaceae bacterium]